MTFFVIYGKYNSYYFILYESPQLMTIQVIKQSLFGILFFLKIYVFFIELYCLVFKHSVDDASPICQSVIVVECVRSFGAQQAVMDRNILWSSSHTLSTFLSLCHICSCFSADGRVKTRITQSIISATTFLCLYCKLIYLFTDF